jgi:predicted O-methyltransferase YrrM
MNLLKSIKRALKKSSIQIQLLREIREGIENHTDLTNRKMNECIQHIAALHAMHAELAGTLLKKETLKNLSGFQSPPSIGETSREAISRFPLMIADKTYNTAHPEYDAHAVRNFPGVVLNGCQKNKNKVFQALSRMIVENEGVLNVEDDLWMPVLDALLEEAKSVPHADQVFERKVYIEKYISDLSARYHAHYFPGWVNLQDALFLYWLVRTLQPKTIVQTGVCNGLSSALMMLALAKNGSEGRLYAIDLPAVFDPNDSNWAIRDKVYGVLIPEGQSSGWMIPDAYQDRFEIAHGDAKELLPLLVDRLDSIDLFYHDSDHTYQHMMFEFHQAKRKLAKGGLIVADDISWNASLWDFSDTHQVPAYNYKGAVGTAFF